MHEMKSNNDRTQGHAYFTLIFIVHGLDIRHGFEISHPHLWIQAIKLTSEMTFLVQSLLSCSFEKDKGRQKQLARERLAARRAKMAAKQGANTTELTRSEIQAQLLEEEKENAKADAAQANSSGRT